MLPTGFRAKYCPFHCCHYWVGADYLVVSESGEKEQLCQGLGNPVWMPVQFGFGTLAFRRVQTETRASSGNCAWVTFYLKGPLEHGWAAAGLWVRMTSCLCLYEWLKWRSTHIMNNAHRKRGHSTAFTYTFPHQCAPLTSSFVKQYSNNDLGNLQIVRGGGLYDY